LLGLVVVLVVTCWQIAPPDKFFLWGNTISHAMQQGEWTWKIMALLCGGIQLCLMQWYYRHNRFAEDKLFLAPIIYMVFWCTNFHYLWLSPLNIVQTILLLLLVINTNYDNVNVKNRVFLSGLLIGLCALIDIASICLIFFIIISLVVNRFSRFKETLIAIGGLMIPFLYYATLYLITDRVDMLMLMIQDIDFNHYFVFIRDMDKWSIIRGGILLAVLFYMVVRISLLYQQRIVVLRRRVLTIHGMTLAILLILLCSPGAFSLKISYFFIPLTFYTTLLSQEKANWVLQDILFLGLIIVLCF
jgi:hypothetical protein